VNLETFAVELLEMVERADRAERLEPAAEAMAISLSWLLQHHDLTCAAERCQDERQDGIKQVHEARQALARWNEANSEADEEAD
jgi:hypothetical protein